MDKVKTWSGIFAFMATVSVAIITKSWWSVLVLPTAILLELFLDYIFESKAKDYYLIVLLTINIFLLPVAVCRLIEMI